MKKSNLILPGIQMLNEAEIESVNGGTAVGWLKKLGPAGLAFWVIDNWKEIKSGAVSAWNDYEKARG